MIPKRGAPFWKIFRRRLIFSAAMFVAAFLFIHFVLPVLRPPAASLMITEAAERQLLRIRKNINTREVQSVSVHVQGQLNGTAMIRLFDPDSQSMLHQEELIGSGKVDARLGGAWRADDCRIEYEPLSATRGELKIEYSFKTKGRNPPA